MSSYTIDAIESEIERRHEYEFHFGSSTISMSMTPAEWVFVKESGAQWLSDKKNISAINLDSVDFVLDKGEIL